MLASCLLDERGWTEFWEVELERCDFIYICWNEMEDDLWILCGDEEGSGCGGATFELEGNFLSEGVYREVKKQCVLKGEKLLKTGSKQH